MPVDEMAIVSVAGGIAGLVLVLSRDQLPRPAAVLLVLLALTGAHLIGPTLLGSGLLQAVLAGARPFGEVGGLIALVIATQIGIPLHYLDKYGLLWPLFLCLQLGMSYHLLSYLPAGSSLPSTAERRAYQWRKNRAALLEAGLALLVVCLSGAVIWLTTHGVYSASLWLVSALAAGVVIVRFRWPEQPMAFGTWLVAVTMLPRKLLALVTYSLHVVPLAHPAMWTILVLIPAIITALILVLGPRPVLTRKRWLSIVYGTFAGLTVLAGTALMFSPG